MKEFFGWVVLILMFAGSICGVTFGIMYKNVKNELDANNNTQIVQELRDNVKSITEENIKLNVQLKNLTAENEANKKSLADLETVLNEKISRIAELENKGKQDEETITTLRNEVSLLQEEKENLQAIIIQNDQTITQLQTNNNNLQIEIDRLNGLIAEYESIKAGTSEVNFYVDNVNSITKVVANGEKVDIAPVVDDTDNFHFVGWSLDKETVVDPCDKVIVSPTNFYAILQKKYKIEFVECGNVKFTDHLIEGSKIDVYTAPTKTDWTFNGYRISDQIYTDLSTIEISSDLVVELDYTFNLDVARVQTALNTKVEDTQASLEYFSFVDKMLIASSDNYSYMFDLSSIESETNEGVVNAISNYGYEISVNRGSKISYLFEGQSYAEMINNFTENYLHENVLSSVKIFVFNSGLFYSSGLWSVQPSLMFVRSDGKIEYKEYSKVSAGEGVSRSQYKQLALSLFGDMVENTTYSVETSTNIPIIYKTNLINTKI